MRYSPLTSLEGVVYPIVTLSLWVSLWVSLFIELKSFNVALTTSTSRHDQNRLFHSDGRTLAFPVLVLLAGAGAAGWCWCCWLVLVLLAGAGAAGWCWCCWLVLVLLAAGLLRCGLRAAGCWLAACTYKHTSTMSRIFFTGYRFLAVPYRFPTKTSKTILPWNALSKRRWP